ncbi:MAG: beta-lactamase family protein [Erythrobacter sp.]|nr:beta-lactamase family protein [Erythrobacter sp.]NCQ63783.1 beta-lactamase family protein [Alphaproteobacteria bacterium]
MRRLLAVLLLFAPVAAFAGSLYAGSTGRTIERFVEQEMQGSALPGVAWAAVEGDEITTGAQGTADAAGNQPVTPQTRFLLGSISKSFTALAVMQLVEAGEIDLDAPVSTYLQAFDGKPAGAVTIRQLLSHTSGYSTLQGNSAPKDSESGTTAIARRAQWYAQQQPATAPGTVWDYSNANYLILGRVIETVSGVPYPDYIASRILQPLGMKNSYVSGGKTRGELARGFTPWFGSMRPIEAQWTGLGSAPQGGVVSTAGDLARYLQVMMNGQNDILSAAGKAQMLEPAGDVSPGYGFGWMVNSEERSAYHTGLSPGFETIAAMIPAQRRGVVVLTNGVSGMGFAETGNLRYGIVARGLDLPQAPDGGGWMRKVNYISLAAAPVVLLLAIVWALFRRDALRTKRSSKFGLFSLWFPLLAMAGVAWVCVVTIPNLFGVSLATLNLFQPDMTLLLLATAVLGLVWAAVRLRIAYSGRPAAA